MTVRLALVSALALAAPPAALGETAATARLLVSATVVRSVQVSVREEAGGSAALRVQTSDGASWAAAVLAASGVPGIGVSRSTTDPNYVVVTVLADGPFPAQSAPRSRQGGR